jgi:hypothetical protein
MEAPMSMRETWLGFQYIVTRPSTIQAESLGHFIPSWRSNEDPFTASLEEFVQEHADVCQDESADVEPEELRSVASA